MGGGMAERIGKMRTARRRLGGWLVALAVHLLSGVEPARAQVRPIRFEPAATATIAEPGDSQILDAHLRSVTAPVVSTVRELLSLSDVLPYCGDGDGCHVTLLLLRGSDELPTLQGERDLFITSSGGAWKVFQGGVVDEMGSLTDGVLETAFLLGGADRCKVAEELTSIGSIERFFLVAVSDAAVGPPEPVECRLRMED